MDIETVIFLGAGAKARETVPVTGGAGARVYGTGGGRRSRERV